MQHHTGTAVFGRVGPRKAVLKRKVVTWLQVRERVWIRLNGLRLQANRLWRVSGGRTAPPSLPRALGGAPAAWGGGNGGAWPRGRRRAANSHRRASLCLYHAAGLSSAGRAELICLLDADGSCCCWSTPLLRSMPGEARASMASRGDANWQGDGGPRRAKRLLMSLQQRCAEADRCKGVIKLRAPQAIINRRRMRHRMLNQTKFPCCGQNSWRHTSAAWCWLH